MGFMIASQMLRERKEINGVDTDTQSNLRPIVVGVHFKDGGIPFSHSSWRSVRYLVLECFKALYDNGLDVGMLYTLYSLEVLARV